MTIPTRKPTEALLWTLRYAIIAVSSFLIQIHAHGAGRNVKIDLSRVYYLCANAEQRLAVALVIEHGGNIQTAAMSYRVSTKYLRRTLRLARISARKALL